MRDVEEQISGGNDSEAAKRLCAPRADAFEVGNRHVEVQLAGWPRPPLPVAQSLALYQLAGKCNRIERLDVGDRFTSADELHGNAKLLSHGENDSAFCGAVELCHH